MRKETNWVNLQQNKMEETKYLDVNSSKHENNMFNHLVVQEMMDLTIENNDLNENKDHEQENEQNTLYVNRSTRWDKDQQSKTNERKKDKSERHHHNLRVRKLEKSNKEDVNINEPNLLKDFPAKKQSFKGKVHIPKGVNLERVVQGSRSEAEKTWPQLTLAKMDHPLNLNDQKADLGEGDVRNLARTLDPGPHDSSNKITTFQVNNSQEMDYATGEGHNRDMFMKCQDGDLTRSLSDDKSNRVNRICKLEDLMKTGK
ncbi:hypothetical protein KY285_013126 [Solanum tuberosum]|nr:hypothetical protein KY285_013126 [Solanum tuberosum]